jgi:hypothetical protein
MFQPVNEAISAFFKQEVERMQQVKRKSYQKSNSIASIHRIKSEGQRK